MSTDAPTEVPRQSRDSGEAGKAWADVARAAATSPTHQASKEQIDALNQTLVNTHVLPGLQIGEMIDATPGNDTIEQVKLSGDVVGTQQIQNAKYDTKTNILTFERNPQLPGNIGNETVSVNMLTGEETVTADGANGTRRSTTREYVGAPATTTVVTNKDNPNQVVQTEATNANGSTTVTQFKHDDKGNIVGVRTQPDAANGAMPNEQQLPFTPLPEGAKDAKVDPHTGMLSYTTQDGATVTTTPQGRQFTTDREGNTTYTPRAGDNLWDVSRDLLKAKGAPNPTEEEILNATNSLTGGLGSSNLAEGQPITFGKETLDPLNKDLVPQELQSTNTQAVPNHPGFSTGADGTVYYDSGTGPQPLPKDENWSFKDNKLTWRGQEIPQGVTMLPGKSNPNEIAFNEGGTEYVLMANGLKTTRNPDNGIKDAWFNGQRVSIPDNADPSKLTFSVENGVVSTTLDGQVVAYTKGDQEIIRRGDGDWKYHTFGQGTYVGVTDISFKDGKVSAHQIVPFITGDEIKSF